MMLLDQYKRLLASRLGAIPADYRSAFMLSGNETSAPTKRLRMGGYRISLPGTVEHADDCDPTPLLPHEISAIDQPAQHQKSLLDSWQRGKESIKELIGIRSAESEKKWIQDYPTDLQSRLFPSLDPQLVQKLTFNM
ncbi:hypothetical protein NP233_g8289 [Leucocoprinus birnbaumii]|uniref:Uncharacterized protein n=1 Tax=Leucocoprinus birnbaumii TaxID=56174 RepID=A0AAD5VMU4_9AGAR|nr:hypothetical protein NP233_g8289 [Leucocoprinus birnbaumii]